MKKNLVFAAFAFLSMFCFAEMVPVTFVSEKGNEVKFYDETTEKFSIPYGTYISQIKNLEALKNLKTFEATGAGFLSDYSFLADVKSLEEILIFDGKVDDFDFLYSLPNLKTISLDNVEFSTLPNFLKLNKLEFLSITASKVKNQDLKIISKHSNALKFVILWNNNITDLSAVEKNDKAIYFLAFNPIPKENYAQNENFDFGTSLKALPENYLRFIR